MMTTNQTQKQTKNFRLRNFPPRLQKLPSQIPIKRKDNKKLWKRK
jgi:hypothetical protein